MPSHRISPCVLGSSAVVKPPANASCSGPAVSCGVKRQEGEEVRVGPRLFCEQFPRGILLLREFGKAGTSTDPLHLQPDRGCRRSKLKHMLGKFFGN